MFLTKVELAAFSDRQNVLYFRSFLLVWFVVSVNKKKEIKSRFIIENIINFMNLINFYTKIVTSKNS